MTHDNLTTGTPANVDITAVSVGSAGSERIRWGAIVAGLFASLSTLVLLSVLGVAIGLTAMDTTDPAGGWGIGASIWGAISMIVAFIVGGWIAGRWGPPFGRTNLAVLHGAMVWAVAIPLSLFIMGNVGGMFAQAAMAGGQHARIDPLTDAARQAGARIGAEADGTTTMQRTQATGAGAAWGTLIALLLGLGAAALGGYLGAANTGDRSYYGRGPGSGTGTTVGDGGTTGNAKAY
jgi:hypothetical protein